MVKKLIRDAISKITGDNIPVEVKKAVQENIAENLNFVEVDPDEIVVFAGKKPWKIENQ